MHNFRSLLGLLGDKRNLELQLEKLLHNFFLEKVVVDTNVKQIYFRMLEEI